MAKGFGGLPGDMKNLMKQAQQMQEKLKTAQAEAKLMVAEATSGGGMVKAVANGENQLVSLSIDKEVIDPSDPSMLEDLVQAAVNEALTKVQGAVEGELSKITGGLNIPGM